MRCIFVSLAAIVCLLLLNPGIVRPADDEPRSMGITASDWMTTLKTEKAASKRRDAVRALEEIGLKWPAGIATLTGALKADTSEGVRAAAAVALSRVAQKAEELREPKEERPKMIAIRDNCLAALRTALKEDKSGRVREASASGLTRVGSDLLTINVDREREQTLIAGFRATVPLLTDALKDVDPSVRSAAAESLGRLGEYSRDAVPALIEVFNDKKSDRLLRGYAAFAIGRIGGDGAKEAVTAFADALTDTKTPEEVRRAVATALGALKTNAGAAAAALGKALDSKNSVDIRRAAAGSLAQIGPEARTALGDLKAAASDSDKFVRAQALRVLSTMTQDAKDIVPILIAKAQETVLEVRLAAIEGLRNMGPEAKDAITVLKMCQKDSQVSIRTAATEALKKIEAPEKPEKP